MKFSVATFLCPVTSAVLSSVLLLAPAYAAETGERWRGLVVAKENDCPHYDKGDYNYDRDNLLLILKNKTGGVAFSPYTRRTYLDDNDVHVEHIVSRKQAHLSGLCNADNRTKSEFASDPLNLTLAESGLNMAKDSCDAATWLPPENQCWFAHRVVQVRLKYDLTIDAAESDALEAILSACSPEDKKMKQSKKPPPNALAMWDTNHNGIIACEELRRKGIKMVDIFHPAWPFVKDGNCDGKACN